MAAPEGKLQLVDSNSGELIYCVDLGAPLYTSYQAPLSQDSNRFYIDVDEDGQVYLYSNDNKQVRHTMPLCLSPILVHVLKCARGFRNPLILV